MMVIPKLQRIFSEQNKWIRLMKVLFSIFEQSNCFHITCVTCVIHIMSPIHFPITPLSQSLLFIPLFVLHLYFSIPF
jgi:hypothetical protein